MSQAISFHVAINLPPGSFSLSDHRLSHRTGYALILPWPSGNPGVGLFPKIQICQSHTHLRAFEACAQGEVMELGTCTASQSPLLRSSGGLRPPTFDPSSFISIHPIVKALFHILPSFACSTKASVVVVPPLPPASALLFGKLLLCPALLPMLTPRTKLSVYEITQLGVRARTLLP